MSSNQDAKDIFSRCYYKAIKLLYLLKELLRFWFNLLESVKTNFLDVFFLNEQIKIILIFVQICS